MRVAYPHPGAEGSACTITVQMSCAETTGYEPFKRLRALRLQKEQVTSPSPYIDDRLRAFCSPRTHAVDVFEDWAEGVGLCAISAEGGALTERQASIPKKYDFP
jgi:hypothetical protein